MKDTIIVSKMIVLPLDVKGILEEAGFTVITNIASVEEAILD
jgi:hypothetical protein